MEEVENIFFVEDWSHSLIGIRVKVEIVRVRDPNSICPSPKASRCDICDIFVVGGAGAPPPRYGPVLLGRLFRTVFRPYTYVF